MEWSQVLNPTRGDMPWAEKASDINPAFLRDIARRFAEKSNLENDDVYALVQEIVAKRYKKTHGLKRNKTKRQQTMADDTKSGYCKQCDAQRVVFRKGTSHILHLILSVLTGGIWLIVWLLLAVKIGGWRCQTCGSTKTRSVQ